MYFIVRQPQIDHKDISDENICSWIQPYYNIMLCYNWEWTNFHFLLYHICGSHLDVHVTEKCALSNALIYFLSFFFSTMVFYFKLFRQICITFLNISRICPHWFLPVQNQQFSELKFFSLGHNSSRVLIPWVQSAQFEDLLDSYNNESEKEFQAREDGSSRYRADLFSWCRLTPV